RRRRGRSGTAFAGQRPASLRFGVNSPRAVPSAVLTDVGDGLAGVPVVEAVVDFSVVVVLDSHASSFPGVVLSGGDEGLGLAVGEGVLIRDQVEIGRASSRERGGGWEVAG